MTSLARISRSLWQVPLAGVLLSGCVAYVAKDIDPAVSVRALESRRLADEGLAKFIVAHGLKAKGDWDLDRLTLAALYFSPELSLARAELAAAKGDASSAAEWPNPSFNFTPGYNVDAAPGQTPWILGYTLTIPVDVSGQRAYRLDAAERRQQAARLRLASAAWAARSAVRQALSEMQAAEQAAKAWGALQPALERARTALAAQLAAGELSSAEAAQVRLALDRAELSARDAGRAKLAAMSRLSEVIGVPKAALGAQPLSYRGLGDFGAPPRPAQARLWAAEHRADVLAALADYSATQDDLQAEVARQYPDLTIGPGYQLDQGEGKWSLGLDVSLPLFNRNAGAIAASEAKRAAAAARFQSVQLKALSEVDLAAGEFAAALADLKTVGRMDADLVVAAKHLAAQEKAGELTALESARQLMEQADALATAATARQRAERSLAVLEAAVQRPFRLFDADVSVKPANPSKKK